MLKPPLSHQHLQPFAIQLKPRHLATAQWITITDEMPPSQAVLAPLD
jgi:hypothetical protein